MTDSRQNEIKLTSENWLEVFWQFVDVVPYLKKYLEKYIAENKAQLGAAWVQTVSQFLEAVYSEKTDEALNMFEGALSSYLPNGWLALYAADILCHKKAEYFRARVLYRQAEREIPEFPKIYLDLGLISMLLTNWDEALSAFQKAAQFADNDPKNRKDVQAKALFNQAIVYANHLNNVPKAAALLRQALEIRPDYDVARRALNQMKQSMI